MLHQRWLAHGSETDGPTNDARTTKHAPLRRTHYCAMGSLVVFSKLVRWRVRTLSLPYARAVLPLAARILPYFLYLP